MPLYHHHPPSLGHNTRRTPASEHNAQPCHVVPRSSPPAQARCVATALSRRAFAMLTPHAFARASAAAGDDPSPRGHHRRRRHRTQSPQARRSVPLQAQELQRRGPSRRACILSCLASSVVRADEPRLRMQESLIVPFWLCFLFSFPQIALLSWLLKRAPSKRQASLLGASTFMMCVPSQRPCLPHSLISHAASTAFSSLSLEPLYTPPRIPCSTSISATCAPSSQHRRATLVLPSMCATTMPRPHVRTPLVNTHC